jgi:rhodanese-related sulfurtransferase
MNSGWIALSALALAVMAPQARTILASEGGLRQMALTSVTPSYPASSVKAGVSGVAVAAVVTSTTKGGAPAVEILEAPDQAIGDAVREALGKWTFPVWTYPMEGKLTFYFRVEQGKGRVLNPQDMPGGPVIKPRPTYTPENPPPVSKSSLGSNVPLLREESTTPITFDELQKLTSANRPTILDVGDRASFKRGHLDGAINIPYDELSVRAGIELRGRGRIVIDCTQEQTRSCVFADHALKEAGFKDVAILRR